VTKALPFTEQSLIRAMRAVRKFGKHVVGIKPDGTLLISPEPLLPPSLAVAELEESPPSPPPVRRLGEKLNGGQGAA